MIESKTEQAVVQRHALERSPVDMVVEAQCIFEQGDLQAALSKLTYIEHGADDTGSQERLKGILLKGRIHRDLGRPQEAGRLFAKAKELARQQQDYESLIEAINLDANILSIQGKDSQAIKQLEHALELANQFDLQIWHAKLNVNLGALFNQLGDYPSALEHLTMAIELHRALPQRYIAEAIALMLLGSLYKNLGDLHKARVFNSEARALAATLQDAKVEIASLNNIAEISQLEGELDVARRYYKHALKLASKSGYKRFVIDNLNGLGQIDWEQHNYASAITLHSKAIELACELDDLDAQLKSIQVLSLSYLSTKQYDEALKHLQQALALAEELEQPKALFEIHKLLAECLEVKGEFSLANTHLKAFYHYEKLIFNQENEEKTRHLTVKFDLERARHEAEEYRVRTEAEHAARVKAEQLIKERTQELEEAHLEVVMRLAVAAEYRDDDTGEHTKRVGRTAAALAYVMGCSTDNVQLIFRAARLHDVGKIGVSDSILLKAGKLTDEEFDLIKTHTTMGGRILANGQTKLLNLAEAIALSHHERWDGRGYPAGLSANAIPLAARIVSVADVLDALIHERPYKQAWSLQAALEEVERGAGSQFDPAVVKVCLKLFGANAYLSPYDSCDEWADMVDVLETIDVLRSEYKTLEASVGALNL